MGANHNLAQMTNESQTIPLSYGRVSILGITAEGDTVMQMEEPADLPFETYRLAGGEIDKVETPEVAARRWLRVQVGYAFALAKNIYTVRALDGWHTIIVAEVRPLDGCSGELLSKAAAMKKWAEGRVTDSATTMALQYWRDTVDPLHSVAVDIQFVCTGNYYRSRLSEIYIRHVSGGKIRTDSKGFGAYRKSNKGMISKHVPRYLESVGVPLDRQRFPEQLSAIHLEHAKRVIVLDEKEHRPMMRVDFPTWEDKVAYWQIEDVQFVSPEKALPALHRRLDQLLDEVGFSPTYR